MNNSSECSYLEHPYILLAGSPHQFAYHDCLLTTTVESPIEIDHPYRGNPRDSNGWKIENDESVVNVVPTEGVDKRDSVDVTVWNRPPPAQQGC